MRSIAALVIVVASASVALACPRGARCVAAAPQRIEVAQARRVETSDVKSQPMALRADKPRRVPERAQWDLRELPAKHEAGMPRLSQVVRAKIAAHLPTYRAATGVSFSVAPVVVSSEAFESTPTLGIVGGF